MLDFEMVVCHTAVLLVFGSETSMSLRSKCQRDLCDACFNLDADSCSDGRSHL